MSACFVIAIVVAFIAIVFIILYIRASHIKLKDIISIFNKSGDIKLLSDDDKGHILLSNKIIRNFNRSVEFYRAVLRVKSSFSSDGNYNDLLDMAQRECERIYKGASIMNVSAYFKKGETIFIPPVVPIGTVKQLTIELEALDAFLEYSKHGDWEVLDLLPTIHRVRELIHDMIPLAPK